MTRKDQIKILDDKIKPDINQMQSKKENLSIHP